MRVTEPSPCFSTSRRIISLVIAHLMNSHDASLFLAPTGMPQPCEAMPGKRPFGPFGTMEKFDVAVTLLPSSPSQGEEHVVVGRVVDAAGAHRLGDLIVGVAGGSGRTVGIDQLGEELGRLGGLRRVERRHQVVRRVAEDVAAETLQEGDESPAPMVLDAVASDVVLLVDDLHGAVQLVERYRACRDRWP